MKRLLLFGAIFLIYHHQSIGQEISDYIGTGADENVTVTSSDPNSNPEYSINGEGYELDLQSSSRFLAYASLGFDKEDLEWVARNGMESWIDDQMEIPTSEYLMTTESVLNDIIQQCYDEMGQAYCDEELRLNTLYWRHAWWHNVLTSQDKLRQKVASALSEILVISDISDLSVHPRALASYFDILSNNAFGNYRQLLEEVTLHPTMGFYLSHLNNPKAIPVLNIEPDENYAREIMQLFSIGLYELNADGSRKIDLSSGLWIPTYDNEDIQGLAKVFTGLSGAEWANKDIVQPTEFGRYFGTYDLTVPMKMFEEWHQEGEKKIVGDYVIPPGQTGMEDVNEALDHLFNHENVGPFLSKRLIQRLVKSNPSSQYIERMSMVFDDNGQGERGDLGALVKAILLDQEAMDCYWFGDMSNGMLRNPTMRWTHMLTALGAKTENGKYWSAARLFQLFNEHTTLSSPSVFNFYRPDYQPNSDFAYYDYDGPEYQILNSSTSSNYINYALLAFMGDYLNDRYGLTGDSRIPSLLLEPFLPGFVQNRRDYNAELTDETWKKLSATPEQFVDFMDILIASGNLSDDVKTKIIASMNRSDLFDEISAAHYATFLVMIDPDFLILK